MSSRHIKKAVDALRSTIDSGIAAQLRIVETAESITANSLTDPVDVVKASVTNDNRSPLIQVYHENWSWDGAGQRNNVMDVMCLVVLSYRSDADLEGAEDFVMRYLWALIETIKADPTLGGEASAYIEGGDADVALGDTSTTRHVATMTVRVLVHSP